MTRYLLVGAAGICGSLVRYILGKVLADKTHRSFPFGTMLINITGALLLGFVNSVGLSGNLLCLLADGFLGAYTTFSTFMYEGFSLFHDKKRLNAAVYILGSVALGVLFYTAGMAAARTLP
ncbi:camphor resistance protein CrcB [Sporobacter termitidis DSM 10068]|uniref:Fluoride-specific ion channel FluC n=1 Tax=Sporobacter termitidis DSM 10068 TaxID=1123282 RepID=A0A1M5YWZ6_9FIRM|nr:fluoride efflux transporter CrcB [Sporobacter termitidis]SHI16557.1 camphor resistance protein CrcB [Sporobacter termitidis DSM 10068]